MPIELPDDYWIHIPAGTYTLGFTPEDARLYGELAAEYKNSLPLPMDAWKEVGEREERTGNAEFLAASALEAAPARVVTLPAFSIASYPVTNELFFRFLAETGAETSKEVMEWGRTRPDWPVRHVEWQEVEAFMTWCGHRIPFEEEWERAARGPQRRLYPWGDRFGDVGVKLVDLAWGDRLSPAEARQFGSPEGFMPFADREWEWCADLYFDADGKQLSDPWQRERSRWARRLRCGLFGEEAPRVTRRGVGFVEASGHTFRLVKHNGRSMPVAPPMTGWSAAGPRTLEFERTIVRPALAVAQPDLEFHRSYIWASGRAPEPFEAVPSYLSDSFEKSLGRRDGNLDGAAAYAADRFVRGVYLGAVTQESFRRTANSKQGLFLWTIVYRLDQAENVLAHPVVFYRMHWDGQWHRFDDRFRPGEDLTPIGEVTPAMVTASVLEAFRLYEEYADADRPPPPSDRRETRTPLDPVFRVR